MPVWTKDEIVSFSQQLSPDSAFQEASRTWFGRFGGIARYIFSAPEDYAARLETAIATSNLDAIRLSLGGLDALEDVSHLLLQYDVHPTTFKSLSMRFASKYVEDGVVSRLYKARQADFLTFVFTSAVGEPAVAGVRGPMFEHFAHHRLPRGGTFRVRPLIAGGVVENWVIPELAHYPVDGLAHLNMQHLRYAQPTVSNFAALDSFADYAPALELDLSESFQVVAVDLLHTQLLRIFFIK